MEKQFNLEVFLGEAQFTGNNTIRVNDQELEFKHACIASGARPFVPPIPGIDDIKYFTSETIFNLTEKP